MWACSLRPPDPRIGFLQEALRWWDRWLKGVETGVEGDQLVLTREVDETIPRDGL